MTHLEVRKCRVKRILGNGRLKSGETAFEMNIAHTKKQGRYRTKRENLLTLKMEICGLLD
jgi:hypothetical protein